MQVLTYDDDSIVLNTNIYLPNARITNCTDYIFRITNLNAFLTKEKYSSFQNINGYRDENCKYKK